MSERAKLMCRWFGHTERLSHPAHRAYRLWPLSGAHGDGAFDVEARCDRCNALFRIGVARMGTDNPRPPEPTQWSAPE